MELPAMRSLAILLTLSLLPVMTGCKPENTSIEARHVRTLVVDPKPIADDRQAIGEVRPRYESDLSFRVAGKVLARRVDVGASVKQGDTLATLDTQDFQNRLRSAEAEVASADAVLVEARGDEARKAKLLSDGWTPKATYDAVLRNLRSAEARLTSAERILTSGYHNEGPTFAPNGRVVMFFREPGGNSGPSLYTVDISGRNEQRVPTPGFASDPAWSPLLS